ncbi:hypothetical protein Hanom_Chr01g00028781 [Helianthus anomalus]
MCSRIRHETNPRPFRLNSNQQNPRSHVSTTDYQMKQKRTKPLTSQQLQIIQLKLIINKVNPHDIHTGLSFTTHICS